MSMRNLGSVMGRGLAWAGGLLGLWLALPAAAVDSNLVLQSVRIDDTLLGGAIGTGTWFGLDVAGIGDVNGDGYPDVAIGAREHDNGGVNQSGLIWLVFLNDTGGIVAPSPIPIGHASNDPLDLLQLEAGSGSDLGSLFGDGLALLPDFDGDATAELKLAVGASGGDPNGAPTDSGAVYLIDIDPTSWTISGVVTIGSGSPNFATLDPEDRAGIRVRSLGDWDGDGAPELAITALYDDDGVTDDGALYIAYLKPDGSGVKTYTKLSATQGGFDGVLDGDSSTLGSSVTAVGDLDGDGQTDLAIGANTEGAYGAVFIVFMDPGCQIDSTTVPHPSCAAKPGAVKITQGQGGFAGTLTSGAHFGDSLAWIAGPGGEHQLVVGNPNADGDRGQIWLLTLASDGTVTSTQRIASGVNWSVTLPSETSPGPRFGAASAPLGDLNGDAVEDLIVGAATQDVGGTNTGVAYALVLDPCPRVIASPIAFDSPNDDGVNLCVPTELATSGNQTLHLYLESGPTPTANPSDVCAENLGEGSEMCAWDVRVELEGGATITGFAANPPSGTPPANQGVVSPPVGMETEVVSPTEFRANWIGPGNASDPTAGPVKIGDLSISADGSGEPAVRLAAK
ncbi:MAG TPA: integrin alpha, partial [Candidatus Polarisedimenticolia bacterium]|nr:integrin alpha [Candidatus Polarisedimenticolia bacterium]